MDDFSGYDYSWNGFIDYIKCFHSMNPLWTAVGAAIFIGTIIGLIPQLFRIIKLRTSYGISPYSVMVTSISQLVVVLNVFCLHGADFYGMLQITPLRTIPRQLTFGNLFILWIVYLPIVSLVFIFYDNEERSNRKENSIKRDWKITFLLSLALVIVTLSLFLPIIILIFIVGPGSNEILNYGKILGTISSFITICQYLPQFITTCKIKDNGSFSLVTLCIQAPGGTLNAVFMMVGNGENWTTWISTFTAAVQQWLLLILMIYYKIKKRNF